MKRCVLLLVCVFVVCGARSVVAQNLVVTGRVIDPQGAAVPDAEIRAAREDGTAMRGTTTDGTGVYRLEVMSPGVVIVDVSKPGFRRHADVITLAAGSLTLDIALEVAGIDDAVVVTAAGMPQITQETSKAITIITAEDIQTRNQNALIDIVRFTPGVQVRNSGGPGQTSSMRIRGLRQDATAVLVDGLRFRDAATGQGDATSFLQTLNFIGAERVEVLRGSGSSLYGTNAVGGVVNIVTSPGGGATRLGGQFEGGSLGHIRTRGTVNGGAHANRLRYSASVLQFNLLDGFDGDDANRSSGAQGLLHYDVTPTAHVMIRVLGSNDRVETNSSPTTTGIPVANISQAIIVDAQPVSPREIERSNQGLTPVIGGANFFPGRNDPDSLRTSAFHTTALRFRHSAWSSVSWQASYQRVHTRRTFTNDVLGVGFQPAALSDSKIVGTIDTADVRAFMAPAPWLNLTAGYEFERETFHDWQDDNLPAPRRTRTETRIGQNANAAFVATQLALLDRRLQVSLSARTQAFNLSNPRLTAVGVTSPYDGVAVVAPPKAVTGDASLAYLVTMSETKLRVHVGNAFRAPGLYERFGGGFSADPVTGLVAFTAYGDPRINPDRYRAVDAGLDQYLFGGKAVLSATAFYNDVPSLTAFNSSGGIRPDTDPYRRTQGYLNSSGGFSRGAEVGIDVRPTSSLRLSGSYTYTRSETTQDIVVPGFFLVPGVFGHTAALVVTNRWGERVDTTFDLFYGSESYSSLFAAGRARAYRYPGFTRAALVAGYRVINAARAPTRVYLHVDNLFNQTFYENGWRGLGRTVVAGVSVGF
jgi:iron complex outermembrane receptor protein